MRVSAVHASHAAMVMALVACGGTRPPVGSEVIVPAGTFLMGSPPDQPCRHAYEGQHSVTLTRDFAVSVYEVTRGEYQEVVGWLPMQTLHYCSTPDCPVGTSESQGEWAAAAAYCNERSRKEGLTACYKSEDLGTDCDGDGGCIFIQGYCVAGHCARYTVSPEFAGGAKTIYDCPGYRLPTEAEWEYAYRAGTQTAFYNGPISADGCSMDVHADEIGWYDGNAHKQTRPVGGRAPNGWGVYDMAGSYYEWVHDVVKQDLGSAAVTDPVSEGSGLHVLRGGSIESEALHLTASARHITGVDSSAGFRWVRTIR